MSDFAKRSKVNLDNFATVIWLFPWLRPENGKTLRMLLRFMKPEYQLELFNNYICLYVGRLNGCSISKMPKNRLFSYLVTPLTLVAMVTRKMI